MSQKIYVVVEQDFEYDDQNYYTTGDAGYPRKAFKTKRKAEENALQQSVASIRGRGFGEFTSSGLSNCFDHPWEKVLEFCEKHGFETEEQTWKKESSEVSNIKVDDQPEALVGQLLQWFNLDFYHVVEMTIGG